MEQALALDDDPGGEFDVDKPTEDDGGVEYEREGPESDPERDVVVTVLLHDLGDHVSDRARDLLYFEEVVEHWDSGDDVAEIVDLEHDGEEMGLLTDEEPQKYEERKNHSKIDDDFQTGYNDLEKVLFTN